VSRVDAYDAGVENSYQVLKKAFLDTYMS